MSRKLVLQYVPIESVHPWDKNPKKHNKAAIIESMREFDVTKPILVQKGTRMVIAGHGRLEAFRELGMAEIPIIELEMEDAKARAYALVDNETTMSAGWDDDLLALDMKEIKLEMPELDMSVFGFDTYALLNPPSPKMQERFLIVPTSVLDARSGPWGDRKRQWKALGIASHIGRGANLLQFSEMINGKMSNGPAKAYRQIDEWQTQHNKENTNEAAGTSIFDPAGTSIFDPVLCELMYYWFTAPGARIIDPFAGGSVRGIVAAIMGRDYTGIDLRPEQVEANIAQWEAMSKRRGEGPAPIDDNMPELTPIEEHGGHLVKRDDLFSVAGVAGGKVRTCWNLAQGAKGLITAGSRQSQSPQVNIVAHVAARLGIPCRVHVPSGELTPELLAAKRSGAEIVQHPAGRNSVIIARAREDAARTGYREIPFGMECDEATKQTRTQVSNIPADCKRIVMPVGSGMSAAGVLWGLKESGLKVPVLGIVVGADPKKRLDKYAPKEWREMLELRKSPLDYHEHAPVKMLGDLPLDPVYEAKCLPYLEEGDLLWVVGIRESERGGDALAFSNAPIAPHWIKGDSQFVLPTIDGHFDFIMSCPPYFDLEEYSDDPADLSNMSYEQFLAAYRIIIKGAADHLRDDRFACFVVGDVRDEKGNYRNFVSETIAAFRAAGMELYNEIILVTAMGSLALRLAKQFDASRKAGKTHQNVLVFVKGDAKRATEWCGKIELPSIEEAGEE